MALRIKRLPKRLKPAVMPLESGDGDLLKKEQQVSMMIRGPAGRAFMERIKSRRL